MGESASFEGQDADEASSAYHSGNSGLSCLNAKDS